MDKKNIYVFQPQYRIKEILDSIKDCLVKGWTGLGYKTIEFEENWKEYTGLRNAHFVSSATAALHIAIHSFKKFYNWKKGDEIITTPFTFISTNHAILYENLKPIFSDIDDYLCLDPKLIQEKISHKTRAIMFVGIGGNTGRLKEISKICKKNNLKLILDAAHMAGTKVRNKGIEEHVGKEADAVIFSFHSIKNLPTADGGMICFRSKRLDQYARKISWLGIDKDTFSRSKNKKYNWDYNVIDIGFKYHGNSIMASMGIVQLNYLDEDNKKRNYLAEEYTKKFKNIKEIKIVKMHPYCEVPSRHLFQIRVPSNKRNNLIKYLKSFNIYTGVHYKNNTSYKMYLYAKNDCPNTRKISSEIITLPLHLRLNKKDIKYISSKIKEFFYEKTLGDNKLSCR